jgi:hypothetical protein
LEIHIQFPVYLEDRFDALRRIIFRSADLASDIAANGLHNPVVLYQGQILDGVN